MKIYNIKAIINKRTSDRVYTITYLEGLRYIHSVAIALAAPRVVFVTSFYVLLYVTPSYVYMQTYIYSFFFKHLLSRNLNVPSTHIRTYPRTCALFIIDTYMYTPCFGVVVITQHERSSHFTWFLRRPRATPKNYDRVLVTMVSYLSARTSILHIARGSSHGRLVDERLLVLDALLRDRLIHGSKRILRANPFGGDARATRNLPADRPRTSDARIVDDDDQIANLSLRSGLLLFDATSS